MPASLDSTKPMRDVLRQRAHDALSIVANGFLLHETNGYVIRDGVRRAPTQSELDTVRDLALVYLVQFLCTLKAAAMNVLPMHERGFFSAGKYPEIHRLHLHDNVIRTLSASLRYFDAAQSKAIPYADLHVRDLGDVYESLLELRLVRDLNVPIDAVATKPFVLRNHHGEKKASGSYYTPEPIVDFLVRQTLQPLLDACAHDTQAILSLKVLDPAMGSGHFLVKAVDVIAEHLTRHHGPQDLAYWKRRVVERCIYGIDVNPMAVELAKVALGLHTAIPGQPFPLLDLHVKCGNALVGSAPHHLGEGFDVVVGNPPWNKLKPAKRDFYGPFSDEVAKTQGPSLDTLIDRLHIERPELKAEWEAYVQQLETLVESLVSGNEYSHQSVLVDGKKTGGDPDLFRFFLERSVQWVREGGRFAQVVPATLWQAEGCTGLRRLLLEQCSVECVYTFENHRQWAFAIDSRFKFTVFVACRKKPSTDHYFPAAFMLRNARSLEVGTPERTVRMSRAFIDAVSPGTLALIDIKNEFERGLIERLHRLFSTLGDDKCGWSVKYRSELHMTNDAWMFRTREWMKSRGFTQIMPVRETNGRWTQRIDGPELPESFPQGGEYWIAASERYYRDRGFVERTGDIHGNPARWFVDPLDVGKNETKARIFPGETYTALYDGRLIHSFDHCYQRYGSGEGPKQVWTRLDITEKIFAPRVFACSVESNAPAMPRCGFRDIARGTDERTMICAIVPAGVTCGNKVPILHVADADDTLLLPAILGSFVADFLLRLRVGATLNWTYVSRLVVPARKQLDTHMRIRLTECVARLSCTTPEMAQVWTHVFPHVPWSYEVAERDGWKRAELRAEIDAIVADLYGLTVPEYAYVLTTFPLLDRDQPSLPGDAFVTDGRDAEMAPRSFVTRDLALLRYMQLEHYSIPADLESFYRNDVDLDPHGPMSRFRIGSIRDLEARVLEAKKRGAIAYVPSGRSGYEPSPLDCPSFAK